MFFVAGRPSTPVARCRTSRGTAPGLIAEFHDRLRGKVREREGREAEPTAGIIDAQSVRAAATTPAASRGYDGGKKVPGRKRHIATDTLGLLLVVAVTAANIGDRDAAAGLLTRLHRAITLVWADGSALPVGRGRRTASSSSASLTGRDGTGRDGGASRACRRHAL
ncbi:transposase [Streptomyces sp. NPDC005151]